MILLTNCEAISNLGFLGVAYIALASTIACKSQVKFQFLKKKIFLKRRKNFKIKKSLQIATNAEEKILLQKFANPNAL